MISRTDLKKDQAFIEAIRAGDPTVLRKLYPLYRQEFLSWVNSRYYCAEEEILDIYQEAVIVFYQNIIEHKIDQLSCSIKTYLFSVGKNLLYKNFKEKSNKPIADYDLNEIKELDWELLEKEDLNHREKVMKMAFQKLGNVCKDLLNYFYYYDFSMEAIKERMGYKNTDTVKSQKRRCMKNLEEILKKDFKEEL